MYRYTYEPHDHQNASFRHFFDKNALTLWVFGICVLASFLALPVFV